MNQSKPDDPGQPEGPESSAGQSSPQAERDRQAEQAIAVPQVISSGHHHWLTNHLQQWVAGQIVTQEQADAIANRYQVKTTRSAPSSSPVNSLINGLATTLIGAAIVWFVGANIEHFSLVGRVLLLVSLWWGFMALAELVFRTVSPMWRTMFRVLSITAYGGTIFQLTQFLNLDVDTPLILGAWGIGGLVYALASRSAPAAAMTTIITVVWAVYEVGHRTHSPLSAIFTGVAIASVLAVAAHSVVRWSAAIARVWRILAEAVGLIGLVSFAILINPSLSEFLGDRAANMMKVLIPVGVAAAVVGVAWVVRRTRATMWSVAEQVVPLGLSVILIGLYYAQHSAQGHGSVLSGMAIGLVLLAVSIATCVWYAVLGAAHQQSLVSHLALAALVVIVALQSATYFGRILNGAWVVLAVGLVLLAVGWGIARWRSSLHHFEGQAVAVEPEGAKNND